MALETPLARTKGKPENRGEAPRKGDRGRRHVLVDLAACGTAGPAYFVAAWIAAGLLYPGYSQLTEKGISLSQAAPFQWQRLGAYWIGRLYLEWRDGRF
jgi:hypothetical protein